ncbi:MAG: signal peptidase II [Treponema sp.]|jgi:signal peptidase II|nr:signal peptidase II [Treponema sp.]
MNTTEMFESGQRPGAMPLAKKGFPFILTILVILADQLLKTYIDHNWPLSQPDERLFIKDIFENGVLQIWHVRNKAIAFSLGSNTPDFLRPVLFIILPIGVLGFLVWYYFTTKDMTTLQQYALAGIIGGGTGNIIDRIFRPDGVVDFISISLKFIPLPIFNPWPTFNLADASVVTGCIIFLVSIVIINHNSIEK